MTINITVTGPAVLLAVNTKTTDFIIDNTKIMTVNITVIDSAAAALPTATTTTVALPRMAPEVEVQ